MRARLGGGLLALAALLGAWVAGPASAVPAADRAGAVPRSPGASASRVPAAQTDWPQFRFDRARTGVQPFETVLNPGNVPTLQLGWADQLGEPVFGSSPAVVGGIAYIGSSDGRLWAYSADGCGPSLCTTPLWTSTSVAQILSSPTVKNGVVYVGSQTSFDSAAGKLNAFSASGCGHDVCPPLWQGKAGTQSILESSPAVAGGMVFVGAFDGKLYAFRANGCGKLLCAPLWTGSTGGTIESSPTAVNGVVYIGSDDGKLYAFSAKGCGAKSCAPLWKGTIGSPVFSSSPAVSGGVVYIGSAHFLAAFDANGCGQGRCDPLWRGSNQEDFLNGSPAVWKGWVYIGLENGLGVFDANGCGGSTCLPLWLDFGSGEQAAVISSPTVANGVVYVGRNTAEVLAWKAKPCGQFQCTQIWSGKTNERVVDSSPTVVNGRVYIGSADNNFPENISGRLYVFTLP